MITPAKVIQTTALASIGAGIGAYATNKGEQNHDEALKAVGTFNSIAAGVLGALALTTGLQAIIPNRGVKGIAIATAASAAMIASMVGASTLGRNLAQ